MKDINQLNISIDGYSEKTYFIRDKGIMPKVLDTVRRLKDLIEINMIVTLHRKNIKYMKEYNELAKKWVYVFLSVYLQLTKQIHYLTSMY